MVFTPRICKGIWSTLRWKDVFLGNPEAPTEEHFVGHFIPADADSTFRWSDQANGLSYAYDLSVNRAQVIPSEEPFAQRVNEANEYLWKFLPPELLEAPSEWTLVWFEAANRNDTEKMEFILEQGFDVNTVDGYEQTALDYAVVPYGGSYRMVNLLVDTGVNLDRIEQLIQKASGGAISANEASEQRKIAKYLRDQVIR